MLAAALLALPAAASAHRVPLHGLPAFAETFGPDDHRAVVITLHGGGWYMTGRDVALSERPAGRAWAARGWTVVNTSYRPRRRALSDVLSVYDRVRRHVGPGTPICLAGTSAGGHLALMVAARRRDVACVVGRGAPTDLLTIHRESAVHPSGRVDRSGPRYVRRKAIEAFGRRRLRAMSPARNGRRIRARVLLSIGERDGLIPWSQAVRLRRAVRGARVMRLAWGREVQWVHTAITRDAFDRAFAAEMALAHTVLR